jgi:hypothetical protein
MPKAKPRRLPRVAGDERKRKYGEKTEMMAVRVPAALHAAVKLRARKDRKPKSETVVALLSATLTPEPAAADGSVFE